MEGVGKMCVFQRKTDHILETVRVWEIRPRLLLITKMKRHTPFHMRWVIDFWWFWRSLTTCTIGYLSDSWVSC